MRAKIVGTGAYVPLKILTNLDLERQIETTDRWIVERTGIRERRIAHSDEATSDLAVHAAEAALSMAGIGADALDLIIVATCTPDMPFPSTACIVQDRLKAAGAAAFDLSAACSGFIYALTVAEQSIRSGAYRTVLVIGAEVMSRIVNWADRNTCILFGDGAGAVVVRASSGRAGILASRLHSDGAFCDLIRVPGGGSALPISEQVLADRLNTIQMKGNETFKVAVRTMVEVAQESLDACGLKISDIAYVIPHQANLRILRAIAERLEISMEKMAVNLDRFGNMSAASVPVALDEAVRMGRIGRGDRVLLLAFGSGLTWGASIVQW